MFSRVVRGFPGGTSGKEPTCQCRRPKRCGFSPWVRNSLWRRAWQSTPVFLPGESHRQRSLAGYSHKELDTTETSSTFSTEVSCFCWKFCPPLSLELLTACEVPPSLVFLCFSRGGSDNGTSRFLGTYERLALQLHRPREPTRYITKWDHDCYQVSRLRSQLVCTLGDVAEVKKTGQDKG